MLVVGKQHLVKALCTVKVDYIVCFCMFLQSSSAKKSDARDVMI